MAYRNEDPGIATVNAALFQLNVDDLKKMVALLPATERPTRKAELIDLIEKHLTGDRLRELWVRLDETQKNAVSETLHAEDGLFDDNRFRAKYGKLAIFKIRKDGSYYGGQPTPLSLFIYNHLVIPKNLGDRLKAFVPTPAAPQLKLTEELPQSYEMTYNLWDADTRKPISTTEQVPLELRETERAAQQDLWAVLRLIEKGRVAVSDKTFQASSATMKEIAGILRDGDFYEIVEPENRWDQEVGPIKAFAWPMLLQAAKFAELHGKKLALTKAGRESLGKPAAETLRFVWQRWLKSKLLDEFNRIDTIKGQTGKGKRGFTAVEGRREEIAEALKQCPAGAWVKFDHFGRFMQAAGHDFAVTRNAWALYISDANYGNLGYAENDWRIFEGRYALCFLFEYAATLGLIDVAYIDPEGVRRNEYRELWGTDDLGFLSRYDGLLYFRLNPLGAYCLGLTDHYMPSQVEAKTSITVMPSLRINVANAGLSSEEALLIETWAEKESDAIWRLDRDKALAAIESGHNIAELREFLAARDEQELPDTVVAFFITTDRNARALKQKGITLLIECADAELAEMIANHERTKKLCLRAGDKHLAVKVEAEEQFRKAVHLLGYGMPRA
jgi:hypothetical protein